MPLAPGKKQQQSPDGQNNIGWQTEDQARPADQHLHQDQRNNEETQ